MIKMKKLLVLMLSSITLFGCDEQTDKNPFLTQEYGTPFEVPPFDKIKFSHYVPAFEKVSSRTASLSIS